MEGAERGGGDGLASFSPSGRSFVVVVSGNECNMLLLLWDEKRR
jgi:hypothetical protein